VRRVVLALVFAGCATPKVPEAEYPCVLHPPRELTPDFAVEQHITVTKDARRGEIDGVLQKRGDELLIVGFGPMRVRAFVLRQGDDEIHFEQSMGPSLPFPPRNVLVDVHRTFFKHLPDPPSDGERSGRIDEEDVTEIWKSGALVERRYERPAFRRGSVRVHYGPGCTAERCEPATVTIVNEWFGYELAIVNARFTRL
jgi:hypothetical protein